MSHSEVKITYADKMLLKFLLVDTNKFQDIFLKMKFTDDNRDKSKFDNLDDEISEIVYQFYFIQNANLIKRSCSVLNLSYRELGQYTGLNENTLNKLASTGEINDQFKKAIELYVETRKLKDELKDVETLKRLLKCFFNNLW
ncbi:hypothetical protein NG767_10360 [Aliarcobacter cryaerophilus]|uniref:hypothetical protein n=1 Tax=Aliarcobacter cryaerophilus TaxID=28198 RepID=UPI003DA50E31